MASAVPLVSSRASHGELSHQPGPPVSIRPPGRTRTCDHRIRSARVRGSPPAASVRFCSSVALGERQRRLANKGEFGLLATTMAPLRSSDLWSATSFCHAAFGGSIPSPRGCLLDHGSECAAQAACSVDDVVLIENIRALEPGPRRHNNCVLVQDEDSTGKQRSAERVSKDAPSLTSATASA
jgi:hypothetical protein